jgi:hypothetical protein
MFVIQECGSGRRLHFCKDWIHVCSIHRGYFRSVICVVRIIEGNAKCRHLTKLTCKGTLHQVFIRINRLEIANFLSTFSLHFNPPLGSVMSCVAPLPFSLINSPSLPPPFPVWIRVNYPCIQCVRGMGYGVLGLKQLNLPQNPFKGKVFWMTTFWFGVFIVN